MPTLHFVLAILLIGHLLILAASYLRRFGHVGALQICSHTFGVCDDPFWVVSIAVVLLAGLFWTRRLPQNRRLESTAQPLKSVLPGSPAAPRRSRPEVSSPSAANVPPEHKTEFIITRDEGRTDHARDLMQSGLSVRACPAKDEGVTGGQDDFEVVEGDRPVGVIFRPHPAYKDWMWHILPEAMPPGRRAMGREASYEEAKAAFWAAWQSLERNQGPT
jgi:hypothetical protein